MYEHQKRGSTESWPWEKQNVAALQDRTYISIVPGFGSSVLPPKLSHHEGTLIAIMPSRTVCSVQQPMENHSCLLCVVTLIAQGAHNDQYIEIKTLLDSVGHWHCDSRTLFIVVIVKRISLFIKMQEQTIFIITTVITAPTQGMQESWDSVEIFVYWSMYDYGSRTLLLLALLLLLLLLVHALVTVVLCQSTH